MLVDITHIENSQQTTQELPLCPLSFDELCSQITTIESVLFGRGAWNERMIAQELHAPMRTYVADLNDSNQVVAYAGYWFDGYDAQIMTIGVKPQYQRQSKATAMLQYLKHSAQDLNAQRMLLEVRVDNFPALALYQRFGFTTMGLRKRYYQPENVDAYTMSLDLCVQNNAADS